MNNFSSPLVFNEMTISEPFYELTNLSLFVALKVFFVIYFHNLSFLTLNRSDYFSAEKVGNGP